MLMPLAAARAMRWRSQDRHSDVLTWRPLRYTPVADAHGCHQRLSNGNRQYVYAQAAGLKTPWKLFADNVIQEDAILLYPEFDIPEGCKDSHLNVLVHVSTTYPKPVEWLLKTRSETWNCV